MSGEGWFQTKISRNSLTFCAHALYKQFQVLNLSGSLVFYTNKRSNGQVRGITLPMFYSIQSNDLRTCTVTVPLCCLRF